MHVVKDAATAALHQETQRIKEALHASECALQAAKAAAATPKPQAEVIDAGRLERARLTDLAGATTGEPERLQRLHEQQERARLEWVEMTEQAGEDCKRHAAAVEFHRESLAEARRLELSAFSAAAASLVKDAESTYVCAVHAMRAALMDLVGARTVAASAGVARSIAGTPLADLGVVDVSRQISGSGGASLPTLGVFGSGLQPVQPDAWVPAMAQITPDEVRDEASKIAETIISTLKGRAT